MKRPAAWFGAVFLAASFAGIRLPQQVQQPAAAFLVLSAVLALIIRRAGARARIALVSGALALCCLCAYQALTVRPVQALAGTQVSVTGTVTDTEAGFSGQRTVVQIETINGDPVRPGVSIRMESLSGARPGDRLSFTVTPEIPADDGYRLSDYADGVYLEADEAETCVPLGENGSVLFFFRRLREDLAQRLRWLVHGETGEIAAAMVVGDRSGITSAITSTMRRAGLSHLLVVSGLHLGMVSGFFYKRLKRLPVRVGAAAAFAATLTFMLIVGFTPSVVRAGAAILLFYTGRFVRRDGDGLTSMGISAAVLCALNPYAAADVGLLLSYSAAGSLLLLGACKRRRMRAAERGGTLTARRKALLQIGFNAAVPACACLATLPILASIGSGVSVWSLPANLAAVPIAGYAVLSGLLSLVFSTLVPIGFLADAFSFLCGCGIRAIVWIAGIAASLPGYFRFEGFAQTLPVLGAALLVFAAGRLRVKPAVSALCAALVFALGVGAWHALGQNVMTVSLVGSASAPSLVIEADGETVVVLRGTEAGASRAAQWIKEQGAPKVSLVVCLSEDMTSHERERVREMFGAQKCADVSERLAERLDCGIMIVAGEQKNGTYAVADVGGYVVCIGTGTVDFTRLPHADLFVAGAAEPKNLDADAVLLTRSVDWAQNTGARLYTVAGEACVLVRGFTSAKLRGVIEA